MDIDLVVKELRDAIPDLEVVYLFGSQGTATARGESDVDLAVLAPTTLAPEARWGLQERLAERLRKPVDLVDLTTASTVFRAQVVGGGKVLFERDAARRHHFEGRVLGDYARLNEERHEVLAQIARRGRVYA